MKESGRVKKNSQLASLQAQFPDDAGRRNTSLPSTGRTSTQRSRGFVWGTGAGDLCILCTQSTTELYLQHTLAPILECSHTSSRICHPYCYQMRGFTLAPHFANKEVKRAIVSSSRAARIPNSGSLSLSLRSHCCACRGTAPSLAPHTSASTVHTVKETRAVLPNASCHQSTRIIMSQTGGGHPKLRKEVTRNTLTHQP